MVALALAAPFPAMAADLATGEDSSVAAPDYSAGGSASLWNGAYAGLYGGLSWSRVAVKSGPVTEHDLGKDLGLYLGVNQALGDSLVGGLELQGGMANFSERLGRFKAGQDWEASARGRLGYAQDQNLFYGLAGLSAGHMDLRSPAGKDANWMTGWTVGAGVERKLAGNVSGRVEYDYTSYGTERFDLGANDRKANLSSHGIKLGVGVSF